MTSQRRKREGGRKRERERKREGGKKRERETKKKKKQLEYRSA